jgi:2-methylcitrate dehydratase PrpD
MATRVEAPRTAPQTDARQSLTEGLVALIRRKPVAEADRAAMALIVLDGVANAFAGRNTEPGRILLSWAKDRPLDAGRRAFVIGGLMHILEVDDLHRASTSHPGCAVIPAAVALARQTGAGGRGFLDAVLHGYEAVARVGQAVGPAHYRIWHNTATCGPYGSAMAAAALLRLEAAQAVHALGNAGTQSAGLWQFLATGAMSKHLHAGRAAEAGVVAAELAAKGFTGPPAILEGPQGFFAGACPDPDPEAVLRDPAAPWQVHATSIKPWPSCRHTHPTIDAALELSRKVKAAEIDRVEVATYAAAVDVCDRPRPGTPYEAKFSLQHSAAISLLDGAVGFAAFEADARKRAGNLASTVVVRADDRFSRAYPASWGAEVSVTLKGGKRVAAQRPHCKGDPEAALSREEMIAKARELLAFGGAADPDRLIAAVLALADDGPLPNIDLVA